MEATHDTPVMARIRKALRAMDMETCEFINGVLVERLLSGRGYWYIISARKMGLDAAVAEVVSRSKKNV